MVHLGKFGQTNFVFLEQFTQAETVFFKDTFSGIQFLCIMNRFNCGKTVTLLENTELNTFKLIYFLILGFLKAFNIYSMNL